MSNRSRIATRSCLRRSRHASRSKPGVRCLGTNTWVQLGVASACCWHFGASAAYETLFEEFGITAEAVVDAAKQCLS